eukprot:scaffold2178_cov323-Prasinococcus_capsulatus_cf.AAC.1
MSSYSESSPGARRAAPPPVDVHRSAPYGATGAPRRAPPGYAARAAPGNASSARRGAPNAASSPARRVEAHYAPPSGALREKLRVAVDAARYASYVELTAPGPSLSTTKAAAAVLQECTTAAAENLAVCFVRKQLELEAQLQRLASLDELSSSSPHKPDDEADDEGDSARGAEERQRRAEEKQYGVMVAGLLDVVHDFVATLNTGVIGDGGRDAIGGRLLAALETHLEEAVSRLGVEDLLTESSIRAICRRSDGLQPHLVAPESGLRAIVEQALNNFHGPARQCVEEVHSTLLDAVEAAPQKCSLQKYPALKAALMETAREMLEECRKNGLQLVKNMVDMEAIYPTPDFFRSRLSEKERAEREAEEQAEAAAAAAAAARESGGSEDSESEADTSARAVDLDGDESVHRTNLPPEQHTWMRGWLQKRSDNGKNWERRFFALNESTNRLYYFQNSTDTEYKEVIDMLNVRVQDLQAKGSEEPTKALRIAAKTKGTKVVKNHDYLTFLAETIEEKYEWLARLKASTVPATETVLVKDRHKKAAKQRKDLDAGAAAAPVPTKEIEPLDPIEVERERFRLIGLTVKEYVDEAFFAMLNSIPKAIVHKTIKQLDGELEKRLYEVITAPSYERVKDWMQEDPKLVAWKEGARDALVKLESGRAALAILANQGYDKLSQD